MAQIWNVSAGGISFVCTGQCDLKAGVSVSVEMPELRTARVIHTASRDKGRLFLGAAFDDVIDQHQVASRFLPGKPFILLIEEERTVRDMLGFAMREKGLPVWAVGSGREALAIFRHHGNAIKLVLLDVGMQGMDGPQTLAELRKLDPAVSCWFMTGGAEKYTDADLEQLAVQRILPKPFDLPVLLAALVETVG